MGAMGGNRFRICAPQPLLPAAAPALPHPFTPHTPNNRKRDQVVPSEAGPTIAGITAQRVPQFLYELTAAVAEDRLDAAHFHTALAAAGVTQDVGDDLAHAFWCVRVCIVCVRARVCVCVCVRERERGRERKSTAWAAWTERRMQGPASQVVRRAAAHRSRRDRHPKPTQPAIPTGWSVCGLRSVQRRWTAWPTW